MTSITTFPRLFSRLPSTFRCRSQVQKLEGHAQNVCALGAAANGDLISGAASNQRDDTQVE